jgi:D-3-phosphoglycerate dehydrogenase
LNETALWPLGGVDRMPHEILILSRKFRHAHGNYVDEFLAKRNCYSADHDIEYPVAEDQLCEIMATAEGVITGLERITPRVIAAAPNLKVVSTGGVGYDHVDLDAANAHGVAVANCAGCNNHSVSELAFGMMLSLTRSIQLHDREIKNGGWIPYDIAIQGGELWGKTLGIVGLGRVGKSSALLGRAFGMQVVATDIVWDITFANQNGISYMPLEKLLEVSDFVSLHCPLTPATRSLIDERAIDLMKPSAYLINTARGPVVKESALVNALASKRIAGAGLDVFEVEPHPDNPYVEFPNVVLTPHIGGSTREAFDRSLYLALVNVTNVLNGMPPHCQINPEVQAHLTM